MTRHQRERILRATAELAAERGYPKVNVADIIGRSGVSRVTFYALFATKDAPFLEAYRQASDRLIVQLDAAYAGAGTFTDGVVAALDRFLTELSQDEVTARLCMIEVLAAGPEAVALRNETIDRITALLHARASEADVTAALLPFLAETVVGGIYDVVHARLVREEHAQLPALLPDVAYSALLPYLGAERAGDVRHRLQR